MSAKENPATSFAEGYRKVSSPYGFSMFDVEATAGLERASRAAQDIVRAHGFERIMPATIDFPDTFSENSHTEMFSLKDNSGERLALRNDITAQVIKGYVRQIERRHEQKLRKFYYAAPVYKDIRKNYPLPREIHQIGCEVIGEKAENEFASLIQISRQILAEVFQLTSATQISDVRLRDIFAQIATNDYIDAESRRDAPHLAQILERSMKVSAADSGRLAVWLFYASDWQNIPAAANSLPAEVKQQLKQSAEVAGEMIAGLQKSSIDAYWQPLCEPRSSYYSGLFFETFVPGFTEPMARGGVYNDLVKRYADIEAGACGFALDVLKF